MDQNKETNQSVTTAEVAKFEDVNKTVAHPETINNFSEVEYCSIKGETKAEKIKVYNALKKCDELLLNHVGETIELQAIYFKTFFSRKQQKPVARVIIFAKDGKTYVTGSFNVLRDLQNISQIFGDPTTWTEPIKVEIQQLNGKDGAKPLSLKVLD